MSEKKNLITGTAGGGLGGLLIGAMSDEKFRWSVLNWIQNELKAMGFVMLAFNIATAFTLYIIFGYFAARDREKRADIKEAFLDMKGLVKDMAHTIKENTEALAVFRAFAHRESHHVHTNVNETGSSDSKNVSNRIVIPRSAEETG